MTIELANGGDVPIGVQIIAQTDSLAAERAAREQAERERDKLKENIDYLNEVVGDRAALLRQLHEAEWERDTLRAELAAARSELRVLRQMTDFHRIQRITLGALKDTINSHGPITKEYMSSAVKRIVHNIRDGSCGERNAQDAVRQPAGGEG